MSAPPPEKSCPDCQSAMQLLFAGKVELHRCRFCGGTWFDHGLLARASNRPVVLAPLEGTTPRRCAYCQITLAPALLNGEIPVETCSACCGVYLDDGELQAFAGRKIELREAAAPSKPRAPTATAAAAIAGAKTVKTAKVERPAAAPPSPATAPKRAAPASKPAAATEPSLTAADYTPLMPVAPITGLQFRCPGCGDRFPVTDGVTTPRGLQCSRCWVGENPGPISASYSTVPSVLGTVFNKRRGSSTGLELIGVIGSLLLDAIDFTDDFTD